MSKHLLSFLLTELKTIRFHCKKCLAVVELPNGEDIRRAFRNGTCPVCDAQIRSASDVTAAELFSRLAALRRMADLFADQMEIEFVLPAKPPPSEPD